MKVVGLISGGKDSIYNLLQCIAANHELVAVANIEPYNREEMDSYMYQSVGHEAISLIATCLGLPIFRQTTQGKAICKEKTYTTAEEDEVEDLVKLLQKVKASIAVEAVAVGAIASDYQRTRVENVSKRLNLKCIAYLWKRDQEELLDEMIHCGIDAIIIKVASMGLRPDFHLGAHIRETKSDLLELNKKFGINICGEGGEYETLTLDCPLFKKKIRITEHDNIVLSNDPFAPVGILSIRNAILLTKSTAKEDPVYNQLARLHYIQKTVKNPYFFIEDCLSDLGGSTNVKYALEKLEASDTKISSSLGSVKMLHRSKSKLVQRLYSSAEVFSFDKTVCNLNYSTGWCFIGNLAGATLAHVMSTLQKHLQRVDYSFEDIVLVELFVRDLTEFTSMNAVYSQFMPEISPPTRICVETCLSSEIRVLMNIFAHKCISKIQKALVVPSSPEKQVLYVQSISHWAPANIGPYSQCIRLGGIYYVAGQIPLIPGNMELLNSSIFNQCRLTLRHVLRIMQEMNRDLTFGNVLQAICYVTSERLASNMSSLWAAITENTNATVASIVVSQLPRKAELEWQVIACGIGIPDVSESIEVIGDYRVFMKRCVYAENFTSSMVCKVIKKRKVKSEMELKLESFEDLTSIVKSSIRFLRGDLQCPGAPLFMLKLFHEFDDAVIAQVITDITKSTENYKVTASGIPVLGGEDVDVCLTIVGICH